MVADIVQEREGQHRTLPLPKVRESHRPLTHLGLKMLYTDAVALQTSWLDKNQWNSNPFESAAGKTFEKEEK
jgi:hypothetical protein